MMTYALKMIHEARVRAAEAEKRYKIPGGMAGRKISEQGAARGLQERGNKVDKEDKK